MFGSPFSSKASLAAAVKRLTITTDSNIFKPETNKVATVGLIRPKMIWFMCDGQGKMDARYISNPRKELKQWAKLRDEGIITEEDFQRVKTALLDQMGA